MDYSLIKSLSGFTLIRHNLAHDGIASVRIQESASPSPSFRTLSGEEILQQHGLHLIRVPTIEPILDDRWFLRQIKMARCRFEETYHSSSD
jgi:hypothetical protein